MCDAAVQLIEHRVVRQSKSAQARHSGVSGQSGYHVRMARSAGYECNVGPGESGTISTSIADGDDEDLMGI